VGALEGVATIDADYLRLLRGVGGNLAQLLVALAVIGSMWFVRVSETRVSATRIVFSGVIAFLLVTPIVAVAAFVINLIQVALGAPPAPEVAHETLSIMKAKEDTLFTMLTLAHVVILVPLAEEAGWRGLLQPSMRRIGVGALGACATTALLFTLVHWSVLAPEARSAGLVMLFILGFALSVLRERTGGIVAPAILHGSSMVRMSRSRSADPDARTSRESPAIADTLTLSTPSPNHHEHPRHDPSQAPHSHGRHADWKPSPRSLGWQREATRGVARLARLLLHHRQHARVHHAAGEVGRDQARLNRHRARLSRDGH
jgi:membrane protease YdiL (CAAX protease family)